MIEDRRKVKKTSTDRYKELDKQTKRKNWERKLEWLQAQCPDMERLERLDSRLMAEKIRELTGDKRAASNSIIKDRDGNMFTERKDVLSRRKQYVEDLYSDNIRDIILEVAEMAQRFSRVK